MSVTRTAGDLAAAHRAGQLQVRAAAARRVVDLWPGFDAEDIAGSWARLELPLIAIIQSAHGRSAGLAGAYYATDRQARGVPGTPRPVLAAPKTADELAGWLEVAPRWAGTLTARGLPHVAERTLVTTIGRVTRNALDGGRDTITGSVAADRQAVGYARLTGANPCAFCAMLASRGPVYKTERAATRIADGRRYHDHCQCQPVAVYDRDDGWPGQDRADEFRDIWDRTEGENNHAKMLAFRRELERPHLHAPGAVE